MFCSKYTMLGTSKSISGFDPRSVPGCQLWLDAADPNTLTLSGTSVTAWADKSGNGIVMNQLPPDPQSGSPVSVFPTVGTPINGLNTVKFIAASGIKQSTILDGVKNLFWVGRIAAPDISPSFPSYFLLGCDSSYDWHGGGYGEGFLNGYAASGIANASPVSLFTSDARAITNATFSSVYLPSAPNVFILSAAGITGSTRFQGLCYDRTTQIGWCGDVAEVITYSTAITTAQRQAIEGYLAWKWEAKGVPQRLTVPTSISGCSVWLDATDPNANGVVPANGTIITSWKDKSGNQADFLASGYSNATVQSSYVNGLNVLNFSGNNKYRSPIGSVVYPLDCYIVLSLKSLSRTDVIGVGDTGNDNFNSLTFGEYTANRWHNGSSGFTRTPNTVSGADETAVAPTFLLMNWSLSNGNFVLRRNGTQLSQTGSYSFAFNDKTSSVFQLGYREPWNAYPNPDIACSMYMAEIVIFNSQLATSPRQQVEGYLAWKWGLQKSLPTSHPYSTGLDLPSTHRFVSLKPFTQAFSPLDIGSCVLWLDAADTNTLTGTTTITGWADKSGNGFNCTVPAGSNTNGGGVPAGVGPAYDATTKTLQFVSSSNNAFVLPSGFINSLGGASLTGIIVGQRATASGGQYFLSGGPIGGGYIGMGFSDNNMNLEAYYPQLPGTLPIYSAQEPRRIYGYDVQSTSNAYVFSNGTLLGSSTSNFEVTYPGYASIGRAFGGDGYNQRWFTVNLSEMLIFTPALTTGQRQQVEGYLAAKWGLRAALPSLQSFKTIPPSISLPSFQPNQISNLALWLDAADTSTFSFGSGSNVTRWKDKSGYGNDVTQSSSGSQPICISTAVGPNSILRFNGSSSLSTTTFTSLGSGSVSFWLVAQNLNGTIGAGVFSFNSGPDGGIVIQNNSGLQPFSPGGIPFNSATPRVAYYNRTNTGSNDIGFVNGTSTSVYQTSGPTAYGQTFVVGYRFLSSIYSSGDICEILIFTGLMTTEEQQRMEGYLAWKWRVPASLPSTHPYRTAKP